MPSYPLLRSLRTFILSPPFPPSSGWCLGTVGYEDWNPPTLCTEREVSYPLAPSTSPSSPPLPQQEYLPRQGGSAIRGVPSPTSFSSRTVLLNKMLKTNSRY